MRTTTNGLIIVIILLWLLMFMRAGLNRASERDEVARWEHDVAIAEVLLWTDFGAIYRGDLGRVHYPLIEINPKKYLFFGKET